MTATRAPTERQLQRAVEALAAAEAALTKGVVDARYNGLTVAKIAEVVGMRQPHLSRKYAVEFADVPADRTSRPPDPKAVKALERVVAARAAAADRVLDAVLAARQERITWKVIADILGVAQPNAVAKYRPLIAAATGQQQPPARPRVVRAKAS